MRNGDESARREAQEEAVRARRYRLGVGLAVVAAAEMETEAAAVSDRCAPLENVSGAREVENNRGHYIGLKCNLRMACVFTCYELQCNIYM